MLERAQGCLMGQLTGDALGSLVEFRSPSSIRKEYPDGVRKLVDGGTFNTIAGQPTDDSEMALLLARLLSEDGAYTSEKALEAYVFWLDSRPFDCGNTIARGLRGRPDLESQANGAMMRVSPLGIYGAGCDVAELAQCARQDAALTHPNRVCVEANDLFVIALAEAISTGCDGNTLYNSVLRRAKSLDVESSLLACVERAADGAPSDYMHLQGWVLIAFQNALYQLTHAESLEEGVVDTVMRGGDTDTNAAICGALLGAVYGVDAVPSQWREAVLNCRPANGRKGVRHARPKCFWPIDAMELAENILGVDAN